MDHFRKASANIHQEDQYNNPSLSAVNAVALAGGLSWTESFEILLAQARRYGLMPDDPKCVRNMLADAGYVRVPGFRRLGSYAELSGFLLRNYPGAARAVAQTALAGNGIRKKRFCAVRRLPDPAEGFVSMDTREEERHILSLWLDYREVGAEKPVPEIPEMSPEDVYLSHQGYLYFQPNPLKNVIGDCVIRAYCAVFGQSWETTLDMLARSCEYKNTLLNGLTIYRSLTSEYEFDPRSRLTEAGKGLTGVEFCDRMTLMCRGGERFFAHMGSTHVVGIIPAVIDGKSSTRLPIRGTPAAAGSGATGFTARQTGKRRPSLSRRKSRGPSCFRGSFWFTLPSERASSWRCWPAGTASAFTFPGTGTGFLPVPGSARTA